MLIMKGKQPQGRRHSPDLLSLGPDTADKTEHIPPIGLPSARLRPDGTGFVMDDQVPRQASTLRDVWQSGHRCFMFDKHYLPAQDTTGECFTTDAGPYPDHMDILADPRPCAEPASLTFSLQ